MTRGEGSGGRQASSEGCRLGEAGEARFGGSGSLSKVRLGERSELPVRKATAGHRAQAFRQSPSSPLREGAARSADGVSRRPRAVGRFWSHGGFRGVLRDAIGDFRLTGNRRVSRHALRGRVWMAQRISGETFGPPKRKAPAPSRHGPSGPRRIYRRSVRIRLRRSLPSPPPAPVAAETRARPVEPTGKGVASGRRPSGSRLEVAASAKADVRSFGIGWKPGRRRKNPRRLSCGSPHRLHEASGSCPPGRGRESDLSNPAPRLLCVASGPVNQILWFDRENH